MSAAQAFKVATQCVKTTGHAYVVARLSSRRVYVVEPIEWLKSDEASKARFRKIIG